MAESTCLTIGALALAAALGVACSGQSERQHGSPSGSAAAGSTSTEPSSGAPGVGVAGSAGASTAGSAGSAGAGAVGGQDGVGGSIMGMGDPNGPRVFRGYVLAASEETVVALGSDYIQHSFEFLEGTNVSAIHASVAGGGWHTVYSTQSFTLSDVAYGAGRFVASSSTGLVVSTDGEHWTEHASEEVGDRITFGNGAFYTTGSAGTYARTVDGEVIESLPVPAAAQSFQNIVFASGHFAALSVGGALYTSSDGLAWSPVNVGLQVTNLLSLNDRFFGVTAYVPCFSECPDQNRYGYFSSTDGVEWQHVEDVKAEAMLEVWSNATACIGLRYMLLGYGALQLVDGCSDAAQPLGSSRAVINDTQKLVLDTMGLRSSEDGLTWTNVSLN